MSHIMTITDGVPSFTCTAPADAACHQYPDCECEHWGDDHEHPTVTHATCWLTEWYRLGDIDQMYIDPTERGTFTAEMPLNASGEIDIEFDECPLWSFIDLDAALIVGGDMHIGRAWVATEIEASCPCEQLACGLVSLNAAEAIQCAQHGAAAAKTMRQGHRAIDCPALNHEKEG